MKKIVLGIMAVFMSLFLLVGCGGGGGGIAGSVGKRNSHEFEPLTKAGYYKWIFMAANGDFYARESVKDEEVNGAGIVYKAEFNSQSKLEKITAMSNGRVLDSGGWIDSTLDNPAFAVVTVTYENGYMRYNFKNKSLDATKGFFGAYSIRFKFDDKLVKAAYLYDKEGNQANTGGGYAQLLLSYDNGELRDIGFANVNGERVATNNNIYRLRISHNDNSGKVLPSELANFGKDDALMQMKTGMAKIAFKYDDNKRLVEVRHFGTDDSLRERNVDNDRKGASSILPFDLSGGAITRYTYDGNKQTISFLGKDEQSMGIKAWGGISQLVYERDAKRNIIRQSSFSSDGSPIAINVKEYGKDVVALEMGRNEFGDLSKLTFIGKEGNAIGAGGEYPQVASIAFEYDSKGNNTQMAVFGTSGDPIEISFDFVMLHKMVQEYNDDNEATSLIFYDKAGKEVKRTKLDELTAEVSANTGNASSSVSKGVITGSEVRMRSGAGANYSVVSYFNRGEQVNILGSQNGWFRVKRFDGSTGWVSAQFCQPI